MSEINGDTTPQEDAGAILTPDEIEARAEKAVDNVYAFLARYGIEPPKKRPKIKYSDRPCLLNHRAAAAANVDIESLKSLSAISGAILTRAAYRFFGLTVSDEAIEESLAVATKQVSSMLRDEFGDADIILYPHVKNMLSNLDSLMAHEIWHLIEDEAGVLEKDSILREGTATFVENLVGERNSRDALNSDHFDVVYHGGAQVVEEELSGVENPLTSLLDPEVRARIDIAFHQKVMPLYVKKVEETYDPSLSREQQKYLLQTCPEYADFRLNPCPETLLLALRRRRYNKLADDFSRQDLTALVEYDKALLS